MILKMLHMGLAHGLRVIFVRKFKYEQVGSLKKNRYNNYLQNIWRERERER